MDPSLKITSHPGPAPGVTTASVGDPWSLQFSKLWQYQKETSGGTPVSKNSTMAGAAFREADEKGGEQNRKTAYGGPEGWRDGRTDE